MLLEQGQSLCGAGAEFVPGFFGGKDHVAQAAAQGVLRGGCGAFCARHDGLQLVGRLDLLHKRVVAIGTGDKIERVAQQAFGNVL